MGILISNWHYEFLRLLNYLSFSSSFYFFLFDQNRLGEWDARTATMPTKMRTTRKRRSAVTRASSSTNSRWQNLNCWPRFGAISEKTRPIPDFSSFNDFSRCSPNKLANSSSTETNLETLNQISSPPEP